MDQETLANHISKLSKNYFETACKIVLRDGFMLNAINVDGANDGGTDFAQLGSFGERIPVAYQITTQKSDIEKKAYKDAEKALKKLSVERYYFLSTYRLSETKLRKLENEISQQLKIQAICLDSNSIAALLLSENLLNKFLQETNYPLPSSVKSDFNYIETALHAYTLLSDDSKSLKESIYDDTILFVLAEHNNINDDKIVAEVKKLLILPSDKDEIIKKRIGALFGKQRIIRIGRDKISLSEEARKDLDARKVIYERELSDLVAAQADLMQDYQLEWSIEDSRKISAWLAQAFILKQFSNLKEIKASIISHPIFENLDQNSFGNIKKYILSKKKLDETVVNELFAKLLEIASSHPLIIKLTRAAVYLAIQSPNPVCSAKSLGAARWSDFKILTEPTVAIPFICSCLYRGQVNRYFDNAIVAVERAKELDVNLFIPYFYINECAGHLLHARKYVGLELNEEELCYSNNAFVSNYFALKLRGMRVPENLLDYLASFSSAIKVVQHDRKKWVRAIMTDLQSILNKSGIEFVDTPFFDHDSCKEFEIAYVDYIHQNNINKPPHLINHDIWALQFTQNNILDKGEHWLIITYDASLIAFARNDIYKGWILNPFTFLDLTEIRNKLSDTQFISLLHSVASYSERTLSIAARIIDRIIMYASPEIQNWEFKNEVEKFKEELVKSISNLDDFRFEVDRRVDEFLERHGIKFESSEEEIIDE